ncbi:MAG: class I SAM-dependent methyltransferase [Chloroflexota bacterium]|nr:MAG: class I SAM-dependent methyltransferase [Chloroflexota bacterium]
MPAQDLDVELYDLYVGDWPDEVDFYRAAAAEAHARGEAVLEVACGTGRVAIRLAGVDVQVTGLDHSPAMLDVARSKSRGMSNIAWVQADMRDFALDEPFGLVIIPGHAFQNIHTAEDQLACLTCIRRHLTPNGKLIVHIDHQDLGWLGGIGKRPFEIVRYGKRLIHPTTGQICRMSYAWAYERATQTAIFHNAWEILGADDSVIERYENEPVRLHCVFRQEMEHLARHAGFAIDAVYGDFSGHDLQDDSDEMIWALKPV